jgi:hypothetical protein
VRRIGAVVASCVALGALPPVALGATVRVDTSGGQPPQVIFEGTGEAENVSVSSRPLSPGVEFTFGTTGAVINPGAGCERLNHETEARCTINASTMRQARMLMGGGDDEVFTGANIRIEGEGGSDDLFGVAMDGGSGTTPSGRPEDSPVGRCSTSRPVTAPTRSSAATPSTRSRSASPARST